MEGGEATQAKDSENIFNKTIEDNVFNLKKEMTKRVQDA